MRALLLIVVAIVLTAAVGYGVCVAAGWDVSLANLATAGGFVAAASVLAVTPLWLSRGADQGGVAQAALIGTVVHLFGSLAGAAVMLLLLRRGGEAVYWIFAFYFATLFALVAVFTRAVRSAPAGEAPKPQPPTTA